MTFTIASRRRGVGCTPLPMRSSFARIAIGLSMRLEMPTKLKMGTFCSGIAAPEVAAKDLFEPIFFSEIEPFPCAVLSHHWPGVPNLGDMTASGLVGRIAEIGLPDIIVAGLPCQPFSVAGLRKGEKDPRNLTTTFIEVSHAINDLRRAVGKPALCALVENVPGLLSDRGNAFGCFLGGLVGALDALPPPGDGSWPSEGMVQGPRARAAWSVLDAQWFGVAQRRRRVFVVVDFGGCLDPAAVLLEPDRLRGDTPPRRETGERAAPTLSARTRGGGGLGTDFDCDGGLIASTGDVAHCLNAGGMGRQDYETETMVAHTLKGEGFDASEDGTGRGTPLVPVVGFPWQMGGSMSMPIDTDGSIGTLVKNQTQAVAYAIQERAVSENPNAGPQGAGWNEGNAFTLEARNKVQAVATPWAVRRLTPVETARLQGFPATSETIMVELCEDAKSQLNALAGIGCTTGQGDAKSASGARLHRPVRTAGKSSSTDPAGLANPAALHVRIDLELRQVLLLNAERLIWSASIAEESSVSPLPMRVEDFAHLAVHMMQTAAKLTPTGRAASRIVETSSTTLRSGVRYLRLSGPGTEEAAASAAHIIRNGWKPSMSTTSRNTLNTQSDELILKTLSFCVLNAIGSSIPLKTLGECISSLKIEVITPHTAITYRGKPAADGPQYKAHGNSMAVPVVRWIMERMRISMEAAE